MSPVHFNGGQSGAAPKGRSDLNIVRSTWNEQQNVSVTQLFGAKFDLLFLGGGRMLGPGPTFSASTSKCATHTGCMVVCRNSAHWQMRHFNSL